jgi:chromosome segregation ATPase
LRAYDFGRLERVVRKLAKQHERSVRRNGQLAQELERRDQRIRVLEEELLAANQCRLDVVKRIDELIAQIDQLDLQLQSLEDRK